MFLSFLSVEGYKNFRENFEIKFGEGLNILVGENGVGKSAIVDALRLLLLEDEFGRNLISEDTFHRSFQSPDVRAEHFRLHGRFASLSPSESVAYLPWTEDNEATLTLHVQNRLTPRGRFQWERWGGASRSSMFEKELFETIHCIYLPPLRDAEAKLREGRGSRLARLLLNLNRTDLVAYQKKGEPHPLEQKVLGFNQELTDKDETIRKANDLIRSRLREALGRIFGQDTRIQYSPVGFNRIIESLRLMFYPEQKAETPSPDMFRSLEENTLGHNNLLYLATVLAELTEETDDHRYLRLLLIEEPEAHLHPQLQVTLLKYLEKKANEDRIQIIITTHSPVVASAASLSSLIHLSGSNSGNHSVPLKECGLSPESFTFVSRWLDATKSTLLFARAVILVEGIAEAMLIPVLARRVLAQHKNVTSDKESLPESLEEAGVTVINLGGIYFRHFCQLFCSLNGDDDSPKINVRCAGITDKDPAPNSEFWLTESISGLNPALKLIPKINESKLTRLFPSKFKTFEIDLAMEELNAEIMFKVLAELWPTKGRVKQAYQTYSSRASNVHDSKERARFASMLLGGVESPKVGKGYFAQALASRLSDDSLTFSVPDYIKNAVLWACGHESNNSPSES